MRIFILITLLLVGAFLLSLRDADYDASGSSSDTLQWKQGYTLYENDFRGLPDENSPHVAISATGINYYLVYSGSEFAGFKTESVFYKRKSWMKRESIENMPYVLKHEQGHFDIAQIYALKLEVALYKFRKDSTNRDVDIQNVFDSVIAEERHMQQQYDEETEHATNSGKQAEWNRRINLVLNTQMAYSPRS